MIINNNINIRGKKKEKMKSYKTKNPKIVGDDLFHEADFPLFFKCLRKLKDFIFMSLTFYQIFTFSTCYVKSHMILILLYM